MMFLWFNLLGAVSLVLVNSWFRANPLGLPMAWLLIVGIIPTTLGTQYGFANAYRLAPSFQVAWFVGSGFTSCAGFLAAWLIFGETFTLSRILGIGMILGGAYCLIR